MEPTGFYLLHLQIIKGLTSVSIVFCRKTYYKCESAKTFSDTDKKNYSPCYNRELKNQMLKYLETGDLVSGYTVST